MKTNKTSKQLEFKFDDCIYVLTIKLFGTIGRATKLNLHENILHVNIVLNTLGLYHTNGQYNILLTK